MGLPCRGVARSLLCTGTTWQRVSSYKPKGHSTTFTHVNGPFDFNNQGTEICLFKESGKQFLVVELVKNGWCMKLLEEPEMAPTCHSLRTGGCPSWFSGPASVELEGQVWAVTQYQPLAGQKEFVCHRCWWWHALIFLSALNQVIIFTNFLKELPSFPSSHQLLELSFCQL